MRVKNMVHDDSIEYEIASKSSDELRRLYAITGTIAELACIDSSGIPESSYENLIKFEYLHAKIEDELIIREVKSTLEDATVRFTAWKK